MEKEQEIKELQEKINSLSKSVQFFQQELYVLQARLNALREEVSPGSQKKTSSQKAFQKDEPPPVVQDDGLENYIGLRFMHIVGIVVLVTGLSIGVKYAIDKELISEIMRISLAYTAGVVLFLLSWRLKKKYHLFSAILFSGSMASLYFTTYAAFVYYHFFPFPVAFAIMIALTVYTVIAAMNYNRQEIAVLGMVGAYGIPFLVSANAERVDLFFSYILLINIGVAFISFRRSWKLMQYLALLITWILFIGWAFMRYDPSDRVMGIVFMAAYYILFLVSALALRINRSSSLLPGQVQQVLINNAALYVSSLLIFGNSMFEMNIASTTGFMALFTGILALTIVILYPAELVLQRLLAWQAIILLVSFIGIRWDGLAVTLSWIGVAVFLFGWGVANKRPWPRLAAIVLIGITLGKLIVFDSASFSTVQKIISFLIIGVLLLLFSFYYQKFNLLNNRTENKE
ncbi:MAG TPA: DUF2339 domain-containing protein [Chitinophagaceae bacterium]